MKIYWWINDDDDGNNSLVRKVLFFRKLLIKFKMSTNCDYSADQIENFITWITNPHVDCAYLLSQQLV